MTKKKNLKKNIIAPLIVATIAGTTLTGCGGGSSTSSSNNDDNNITTIISDYNLKTDLESYFNIVDENKTIELGFSPIKDYFCNYIVSNSDGGKTCINTNPDINSSFNKIPNYDPNNSGIDYYIGDNNITSESFEDLRTKLDEVKKNITIKNEFDSNLGLIDINSSKVLPNTEICFNDDIVSATLKLENNKELNLEKIISNENNSSCFELPFTNTLTDGIYSSESLDVISNNGNERIFPFNLTFKVNEYVDSIPEVSLEMISNPLYLDDGITIRDVSNFLNFECYGSDSRGDTNITLESDINGSVIEKVYGINTVELSDQNISNLGNESLEIKCSVKNNDGIIVHSTKNFLIDENQGPEYTGDIISKNCNLGDSITLNVPDKNYFNDPEKDNIEEVLFSNGLETKIYNCSSIGTSYISGNGIDEFNKKGPLSNFYKITTIDSSSDDSSGDSSGGGQI